MLLQQPPQRRLLTARATTITVITILQLNSKHTNSPMIVMVTTIGNMVLLLMEPRIQAMEIPLMANGMVVVMAVTIEVS